MRSGAWRRLLRPGQARPLQLDGKPGRYNKEVGRGEPGGYDPRSGGYDPEVGRYNSPMAGFNTELGLERGGDGTTVVLETQPEHEVIPGTVHFAVLATVAEVAAAESVGATVVPAQVSLNLLSRAGPGRLEGRGTLIKRGGRLAVAEGEVRQDGKVVAKATVTFALV